MTARSLVSAGLCAVLVPLVSAVSPLLDLPGAALPWTRVDAHEVRLRVRLKPDASEVRLKPDTTEVRLTPDATNGQASVDVPVKSERLESRSAAAGLSQAIDAVARAERAPVWLAWRAILHSSS